VANSPKASAVYGVAAEMIADHLYDLLTIGRGESYGVSGGALTLRGGTAVVLFNGSFANGQLPRALRAMKEYWDDLAAGKIDDDEMAQAKARLTRSLIFDFATSASLADLLTTERNLGRDIAAIEQRPAELLAVTVEELRNALAACREGGAVSIVGN